MVSTTANQVTAETHASTVTVRLFAGAADIAKTRSLSLHVDEPLPVREAFLSLCSRFPALREMEGRLLFAVNAEYAGPELRMHAGDELALIPPVSAGATS
jgi:molybdopterin converting factor small subunit